MRIDMDEVRGAQALEAASRGHHRRLVGLPAPARLRGLPRNRRRGRREPVGRHGALRRSRRRGPAPLAGAPRACRVHHRAQDARRPALWHDPRAKQEFAKKLNSAVFPGQQGGPLDARRSPRRPSRSRSPAPPSSTSAKSAPSPAPRSSPSASPQPTPSMLASRVLTGGTDVHLVLVDLRDAAIDGQAGRGPAARGRHHRQPQRRALRPAPADGHLGPTHRHPRARHPRLRRRSLHRGRRHHRHRLGQRQERRRCRPARPRLQGRPGIPALRRLGELGSALKVRLPRASTCHAPRGISEISQIYPLGHLSSSAHLLAQWLPPPEERRRLMSRVLILGGGTAGTMVANRLRADYSPAELTSPSSTATTNTSTNPASYSYPSGKPAANTSANPATNSFATTFASSKQKSNA